MKKLYSFLLFIVMAAAANAHHDTTSTEPAGTTDSDKIAITRGDQPPTESTPTAKEGDIWSLWRFSANVGYTYRTAEAAEGMEDIVDDMRGGIYYGFDCHRFLGGKFAVGARFTGRHYSTSKHGLKLKVNTYYFAPSIMWRLPDKRNKNAWILGASIGYLSYHDKTSYDGISEKNSEGCVGLTTDLGYDIRLSSDMFLGLRVSFFGGSFDTGYRDYHGDKVHESLAAIEVGASLVF